MLVSVEAAFRTDFVELLGKVIVVVGHAERDGQIAFVADLRALVSDADLEVAKILVLVGLQCRFTENFSQHLAGDFVPFTRLGVQVGLPFRVPILLLSCLQLPAFVGVANELSGVEFLIAACTWATGAGLPTSSTRKAAMLASVRGRSRTNSSRQITLATRSDQP